MKRVLITGANSYIGMSFEAYAKKHYSDEFEIDTVDMQDKNWKMNDFSKYDAVFHVAGIAHADVGNVSEETKKKYYAVNTEVAIETAKKAKSEGVKQFVFMSSMIIYGESAPYGKQKMITASTKPKPANFYGDSKLQADIGVRKLETSAFQVAVLRPPMIYGKGSKGNYATLSKLARKLPIFPNAENQRSMLYIENLCEFLCKLILSGKGGIFFPQNREYTKTCDMVQEISHVHGKRIVCMKLLNLLVWLCSKMSGKVGGLINKAFGNSCYEQGMSEYDFEYRVCSLKESIARTEGIKFANSKKILILASVASMIDQFNMHNIKILLDSGYEVQVIANFKVVGSITEKRAIDLKERLAGLNVKVYHVPIPRKIYNFKAILESYVKVKKICEKEAFSLIHCHSPIGGVIARIVAKGFRKNGTKVIYTAHGFHFFKGSPIVNWILFYPIEWLCSWWTDILITINKEDYNLSKTKFHAKKVEYISGVGIDINKFKCDSIDKIQMRKNINIPIDAILLVSVGELNKNKNHEVVIRAISKLNNPNIYYVIAGVGYLQDYLLSLIKELKLENQIILLGYREDIPELYNCADICVFPSFREGLGLAGIEGMASGLPLICSDNRGTRDYAINGYNAIVCSSNNVDEYVDAIKKLYINKELSLEMGKRNLIESKRFDINNINVCMKKIYKLF